LQRVLAPEFHLKIFQFKVNAHRLQLEPLYKGWGHGCCLMECPIRQPALRHHTFDACRDRKQILL
jgi:hypothetical protein